MSKLLRSALVRMKKLEIFWLSVAFCFGVFCFCQYQGMTITGVLETYILSPILLLGILMPVFCSLFVGTEYSDGTIRNKLIIGHYRSSIYLSNFAVNMVVSLGCFFLLTGILSIMGVPLLGGIEMKMSGFLLLYADAVLLCISYAAIYNMISMLCTNKTYTAIFCILTAVAFLFLAVWLTIKLGEPKWLQQATLTAEGVKTEMVKNPKYVDGIWRSIYQFLLDVTPGGQQLQLAEATAEHPVFLGISSLLLILVTNTVGIFFFKRKDIK